VRENFLAIQPQVTYISTPAIRQMQSFTTKIVGEQKKVKKK
jgi:hypothetical protein